MTTTDLMNLLKDIEFGASGRSREISFEVSEEYISEPIITISSTGDGIAGAQLCLQIKPLNKGGLVGNHDKICPVCGSKMSGK